MSRRGARQGALYRAVRQMRENPWLTSVAVSTLTVALAIVGAYLTLVLNLDTAGRRLTTGAALMVVLHDDVSPSDGASLAREIIHWPQVVRARFVSRGEALARFRRQLGPHAGLLDGLGANPLPNAVEVELTPGIDGTETVVPRLAKLVQVAEVVTSRPWLNRLEQAMTVMGRLALAVGGLLFLGVVLLSTNTVRLAVYLRRDELEIMDLVGASTDYVRVPFVLEALLQALLAAGLASLLLWALLGLLGAPAELPLGVRLSEILRLPPQVPVVLAGVGALAGVLGGMLGVGRVLRNQVRR